MTFSNLFQGKLEEDKKKNEDRKVIPHFWNLNEDPALTAMVIHFCNDGRNIVIFPQYTYKYINCFALFTSCTEMLSKFVVSDFLCCHPVQLTDECLTHINVDYG